MVEPLRSDSDYNYETLLDPSDKQSQNILYNLLFQNSNIFTFIFYLWSLFMNN